VVTHLAAERRLLQSLMATQQRTLDELLQLLLRDLEPNGASPGDRRAPQRPRRDQPADERGRTAAMTSAPGRLRVATINILR
jgi:hypothetical protein